MKIQADFAVAWAIATDRANAQMRAAGRKCWNRDDYNHACHVMRQVLQENDIREEAVT